MNKGLRIAITGIGPLSSGGSGKDEVWKAVLDRRTGLVRKKYEAGGEEIGEYYVHEIKSFSIDGYGLDESIMNEIASWKEGEEVIDLYYFLGTIKMAIDDSGLEIGTENRDSIGLILAHENMGLDHFYAKVIDELSFTGNDEPRRPKTKKGFLEAFYGRFHRTGYELQTFMTLHHIAKMFNIRGYSLFLNNACASGLFALEAAADTIRSGKCKKMIVSAVDRSSIFKQIWFNRINMCAKDGRIKPFAAGRDGFTLGDGGAALVLEGMEDAVDRKADIYAEYICGSYALEGWKVTYPDVTTDLYKDVILKAVKTAGIDPSDIGLVVPHGVGTTITDGYEAKAISKIFGKKPDRPIISALKPYTGHTLGSTALLETAIMLIGMRENKVPATLNCDNIDSALGINILRETISADVKIAVKTACGFAGFNGAGIFKKV